MTDNQYYEFSRSEMIKFLPDVATTVLEVGCGGGKFGEQLLSKGISKQVFGIEPDAEACERAKNRLTACYNTFFDKGHLPEEIESNKFDCIVFNDVLEHLVDPWSALELCKTLLKAGGSVVVSLPNILYFHDFFQMFLTQDWKYENSGIFDKTHLRFFTRKSIERLFAESDYKIDLIEGINPTASKKFILWNIVTFGRFKNMKYLQFALRAKLK